jgi:hypothetical protein
MTTTTAAAAPSSASTSVGFGPLLVQGLLGAALAGTVNLALYFGAHAAGVSFEGDFNGLPSLPVPMVFLSGVVMAIPAAAVAWAFGRFTGNGARNYLILAVAFDLLSLGGPVGVKGLSTGGLVAMELMHLVAGLGIAGLQFRALKK